MGEQEDVWDGINGMDLKGSEFQGTLVDTRAVLGSRYYLPLD